MNLGDLQDFLFPHEGNGYKPGIFTRDAVVTIAAALLFLEVAWFAMSVFVFKNQAFLGAVLPGVLTSLANDDRAAAGVPALAENALLDEAAQAKANDMAAKGYFSHVSPDGTTPWYWIAQAGYRYLYAGENLAVDFSDSADVERAWMNSPTHRANIVKPQYTQIGFGIANGAYQGHPATFVVQFFGSPAPVAAVAGKGAGVSASVAAAPASVPQSGTSAGAPAAASVPEAAAAPTQVLGESSAAPVPSAPPAPSPAQSGSLGTLFAGLAASPSRVLLWAVGGLFALIALLFLIAVFTKFRIQFFEVLVGGIVLLAAAGGSFLVIQASLGRVEVPQDTQPAAVYAGLGAAAGN